MAMNPLAVDKAGISQLRSSHRFSSATSSPSGLLSSVHISQSEMKSQILREFNRATFLVDLTAEGAPLQADSSNVQKLLDRLRVYHNITHHTLLGNDNSTKDAPQLPPNGFATERNSYEPLTHFLNIIVCAAKECLTPWAARHLRGLQFLPYGVEMQDKVDSEKPLKPDVLGLVCSPPNQQKIFWNDVAIIIEVKSKRLELIQQLSTYARCYLATNRRRSFSIAIAFDHEKLRMRFLIFHRAGLSSSHELSLHEEAGFQSVVEHMVGVLSIPDEKAFDLDMARFENVYRINNRDYEIVRPIHVRNSVRGRATAVYSIRVCPPDAQDSPASLRSRWLTLVDEVADPRKWCTSCHTRPRGTPWKAACYLDPSANSESSTSLVLTAAPQRNLNPSAPQPNTSRIVLFGNSPKTVRKMGPQRIDICIASLWHLRVYHF
ncbi:hypothetical protein EDB87DRAFT_515058 [Lactarius vividus]|nr:hypothetical protein EDB87DRAFT_515058 [Lactarius vividus]